jgi:hypothetical protein
LPFQKRTSLYRDETDGTGSHRVPDHLGTRTYRPDLSRSIFSKIVFASVTASEIAATYEGEFLGAVASLRAARIDAQIAITADFRGSSTAKR